MIYNKYRNFRYRLSRTAKESVSFDFSLFLKVWINDQLLKRSPLKAGLPWMTYNAILYLNDIITSDFNIMETGCGGSTIFFLNKACRNLISIEHDDKWMEILINDKRIRKFSHRWEKFCENLNSSDAKETNRSPYLDRIKKQPKDKYDLVSIDGRLRSDSLIIASTKVKNNGYILLDNSERPQYQAGINHLDNLGWKRIDFTGLCYNFDWESSTSIWQKKQI